MQHRMIALKPKGTKKFAFKRAGIVNKRQRLIGMRCHHNLVKPHITLTLEIHHHPAIRPSKANNIGFKMNPVPKLGRNPVDIFTRPASNRSPLRPINKIQ